MRTTWIFVVLGHEGNRVPLGNLGRHGHFYQMEYCQRRPSMEADQAWNVITHIHSSRLGALGQWDATDDVAWYAVQLGCLNLLRQWSFSPRRDAWAQNPEMDQFIRKWRPPRLRANGLATNASVYEWDQAVLNGTCWGDTGTIIRHYPTEPDERVRFDTGTLHKCRNFGRSRVYGRSFAERE
ncbi:hypothetical protein LZ32DRAFT_623204 [Colletotrichum eremochloae]|nr:hypothetical protein LZ32DRAFT_623204 [Colletotrichum eremochloae]